MDASENLVDAEDVFKKAKKASTRREKLKQTASTKEAETFAISNEEENLETLEDENFDPKNSPSTPLVLANNLRYICKVHCNIKKRVLKKMHIFQLIFHIHIISNSVTQKIQILPSCCRGALYYCVIIIRETRAILVKLVRN